MSMSRRSRVATGVGAVFLLIQLVPYGHDHSNPPVTGTPSWDSPRTQELAERACFNCHSHATRWPWYASVAPVSWLVQHDVVEGRAHLDFSAFDRPQRHAKHAAKEVEEGDMPPFAYRLMHPEARLTSDERAELVRGFTAMFGRGEPGSEGEEGDDD